MAAKLLELPPTVEGAVVECGSWLGGTTTNLSVICDIVGRELIVYDSFEGLPAPEAADNMKPAVKGSFKGSLETVQGNVRKYGVIERCQFRKGWFKDTLPSHSEPIAFCFIDVDLKSSMHDCIVNLWPHLALQGYLFFDEYVHLHNCALFFSERFWRDYLDTKPPGLMGTGTGVGVGQYFLGPWMGPSASPPSNGQRASRTRARASTDSGTTSPNPRRSNAPRNTRMVSWDRGGRRAPMRCAAGQPIRPSVILGRPTTRPTPR